jgi:hypothetical protein
MEELSKITVNNKYIYLPEFDVPRSFPTGTADAGGATLTDHPVYLCCSKYSGDPNPVAP